VCACSKHSGNYARVFPRFPGSRALKLFQGTLSRALASRRLCERSRTIALSRFLSRARFREEREDAATKGDGVPIIRMPLSIPGLRGGVYKSHHQMTGAARGTTSQTFLTRGGSIVVHPPAFFLGPSGVRDPAESHPSRPVPADKPPLMSSRRVASRRVFGFCERAAGPETTLPPHSLPAGADAGTRIV